MDRIDKILAQWRRERPDLDTTAMGLFGRLRNLALHLSREMEDLRPLRPELGKFRHAGDPAPLGRALYPLPQ